MLDPVIAYKRSSYRDNRPHPIGRPPKLTDEMIEMICDFVAQGEKLSVVAALVGISESTLFRWLAIGRREGAEPIYVELVARVDEATECSEIELRQNLRIAAQQPQHWRASAWMLERRFPEKYGKPQASSLTGRDTMCDEGTLNRFTVA